MALKRELLTPYEERVRRAYQEAAAQVGPQDYYTEELCLKDFYDDAYLWDTPKECYQNILYDIEYILLGVRR